MGSMTRATQPALPDFELAELRGFDPKALDPNQPMGRFILLLAAIFNDLKGALYVVERLRAAAPLAKPNLAWLGQVVGMQIQNKRIVGGILHELMNAIEGNKGVVGSSEFVALVAGLKGPPRAAWTRVKRIALAEDRTPNQSEAASQILHKIRNKVAFHYDTKIIAQGYQAFFADQTQQYRDKAILSDGDRMESTRFYFADGAMEASLNWERCEPSFEIHRHGLREQSRDGDPVLALSLCRHCHSVSAAVGVR
jgi:hypothetical protein